MQMLADGTVLAVGGEPNTGSAGGQGEVSGGVLPAEIWDPNTETVDDGRFDGGHPRLPHVNAAAAGRPRARRGQRPRVAGPPGSVLGPVLLASVPVQGAPADDHLGTELGGLRLEHHDLTPDAASIQSVNLVDLGTSTHQMDFNQHFVPLSFTAGSGSLTVQTPANANWAPPGDYMLFIVEQQGVPSVASFITLGSGSSGSSMATPSAAGERRRHRVDGPERSGLVAGRSRPRSAVTSYTVTPYTGSTPLRPTTVTGSPAPTSATVSGLVGVGRTRSRSRRVAAHGTSPASKPKNVVVPSATPRPAFVQNSGAMPTRRRGCRSACVRG